MNEIVNKVLEFSDSYKVLEEKIRVKQGELNVAGNVFKFSRLLLLAVGKSSIKMAKFFLQRIKVSKGIVITPEIYDKLEGVEILQSTHPQISQKSLKAGERVVEVLKKEDYDLVLFLLSGGASALLEYTDIPLEELRSLNDRLVKSGLTINEINVVRKHLSKIKGGWLANYSKSPIVSLIISDVPGGDLSAVGSGPTVLDSTTVDDAIRILKKIGIELKREYLIETPKSLSAPVYNFKILDVEEVLIKLRSYLGGKIISSEVRGDAFSFGANLAGIGNTLLRIGDKGIILAGGEPEVKIEGKGGKGGRNGEVCLGFLKFANKGIKLYAIATDGIDGNSEYAGCIVEGGLNIDVDKYILIHSSYELLEKINATIYTGFTGNNVNNVYLLEVGK
ncbi:glycerate kinase [Sulfolobus sp. SCGC AB-777_L09]|nr:glycerate kinase [Sulfolobus sp. SCGC AB-777_L09]